MKRYVAQNDVKDPEFLHNLAHTLNCRRSKLAFRVAFTAEDHEELNSALDDVSKGILRPSRVLEEPRMCFAFTGM